VSDDRSRRAHELEAFVDKPQSTDYLRASELEGLIKTVVSMNWTGMCVKKSEAKISALLLSGE
jgi:hypothetical protein